MRCIAIDDEPLALKLLERYCSQVPTIRLLGAYTDPLDGVAYIRSMQPDLIFLDIRMPDISGIDIAQLLGKNTMVIFTTAHREYAVEGFDMDVVDYLLKPFDFERFLRAYGKAEQRLRSLLKTPALEQASDGRAIFIKCSYKKVQLPLHAILYIESFNNYLKIVTPDKVYMPTMTMKTMLNLLPEAEFVRVHKSFAVAVDKIRSFNSVEVVAGRKKIPVGRSYHKEFLKKMEGLKGRA